MTTGAVPAWPSPADEEYYAHVQGFDQPVEFVGGEPVTAVQRVMLDLFGLVEDSIREYRSVLPPRYEPSDMGAHRGTGSADALLRVFEYLTGRPSDDALRIVVELLRDRARPDEVQVLEAWVRENPSASSRPVLALRTLSSTESAALARLDSLLRGQVVTAPAGPAPMPPLAASMFMSRLAAVLCASGQALSVSAAGVAVIDAQGDEVEVFDVSELPEPFAAEFAGAYAALVPQLGSAFEAVARPVTVARPGRSSDARSASV